MAIPLLVAYNGAIPPKGDDPMLMTTEQVAAELGVSVGRIHQLIKGGRLKATRFGRSWAIDPKDLDAVRVRKPGWKLGRPRGKRAKPTTGKRKSGKIQNPA